MLQSAPRSSGPCKLWRNVQISHTRMVIFYNILYHRFNLYFIHGTENWHLRKIVTEHLQQFQTFCQIWWRGCFISNSPFADLTFWIGSDLSKVPLRSLSSSSLSFSTLHFREWVWTMEYHNTPKYLPVLIDQTDILIKISELLRQCGLILADQIHKRIWSTKQYLVENIRQWVPI